MITMTISMIIMCNRLSLSLFESNDILHINFVHFFKFLLEENKTKILNIFRCKTTNFLHKKNNNNNNKLSLSYLNLY